MEYKLSGYTTTRNCVEMDYPFEESIKSLLSFCDEVVVADSSDGTDGTQERLESLMEAYEHLSVYHVDVPWDAPNHGIYDGQMKAAARAKCTGDYCWQQDVDEIAEDNIRAKIDDLLGQAAEHMNQVPIIALPVVEYWGPHGKVRADVNPWKWRLSKNDPTITHGIPQDLRKFKDGLLYARPGTDGCDYIHTETGQPVPFSNFVSEQVEQVRRKALSDDEAALEYKNWFEMVTGHLPTVYHFSWWSIASKIKKFRLFWNQSWISLYGEARPEKYNPFFEDKALEEVTDEEIEELARKLEAETGGHVFHKPWDGSKVNHVELSNELPELAKDWCENHKV